ncbi:unnamed protein product [Prorocentrum cordatum]|uniref:Uncharacterized protein n=1 Tax=Prorocentrum cordatum TaxID=2364126 RepID=A0ABN9UTD3_9DINO|nr:unnamed protein product [Polarella glacialis]
MPPKMRVATLKLPNYVKKEADPVLKRRMVKLFKVAHLYKLRCTMTEHRMCLMRTALNNLKKLAEATINRDGVVGEANFQKVRDVENEIDNRESVSD